MELSTSEHFSSATTWMELTRESCLPSLGCLSSHEGTHNLKSQLRIFFISAQLSPITGPENWPPISLFFPSIAQFTSNNWHFQGWTKWAKASLTFLAEMSCYMERVIWLHAEGRKEVRGESLVVIKDSISHLCTYYSHLYSRWKENAPRKVAVLCSLYLTCKQTLFSICADEWWRISRAACVSKAVRVDLTVSVCCWRCGCWSSPALCLCQLDTSCQCLSTVSEEKWWSHLVNRLNGSV